MQNLLLVDWNERAHINGLPISFKMDGIIEVWWDSVADIRRAFEEPRFLQMLQPDMLAFGDVGGAWGVTTNEVTVLQRGGFAGLNTMFIFLKRSDGIDHAEFMSRWRDVRDRKLMTSETFRSHVGRFVENLVGQDPADSLSIARPFDLVAELSFDSLRHLVEFAADPSVITATVGAGADHTDRAQTLIYIGESQPASAEWFRRSQAGP